MNPEENKVTEIAPTPAHRMVFGILSYLGILVIISYIFGKNDSFVKFHIKQGLLVLCINVIVWVVGMISWHLWPILNLINLVAFIFSIIGIVNVVQKKEKELPIIGQFSKYFTF